jgi:hypothetical protein
MKTTISLKVFKSPSAKVLLILTIFEKPKLKFLLFLFVFLEDQCVRFITKSKNGTTLVICSGPT